MAYSNEYNQALAGAWLQTYGFWSDYLNDHRQPGDLGLFSLSAIEASTQITYRWADRFFRGDLDRAQRFNDLALDMARISLHAPGLMDGGVNG